MKSMFLVPLFALVLVSALVGTPRPAASATEGYLGYEGEGDVVFGSKIRRSLQKVGLELTDDPVHVQYAGTDEPVNLGQPTYKKRRSQFTDHDEQLELWGGTVFEAALPGGRVLQGEGEITVTWSWFWGVPSPPSLTLTITSCRVLDASGAVLASCTRTVDVSVSGDEPTQLFAE